MISPMTVRGFLGGRRSLGGGPSKACCRRHWGMYCGCLRRCGSPSPGGLILGCMRVGRLRMLICLLMPGLRTLTRRCGGFLGRCRLISGCGRSLWRLRGLTRGFLRCGVGTRIGSAMIRLVRIPCGGMTRSGTLVCLTLGR